jgi:leucyl/phenylalanyl-tRNA--protein transferase
MAYWIKNNTPPDPTRADANGLVALGGSLQPSFLLSAYQAGCFPWSSKPVLNWWSPDPRMIFDLDAFSPSKSLQKSIRRNQWSFAINQDFGAVIRACANTRPDTWITPDIIAGYTELHRLGHVHSVEVYEQGSLVGGLYGVSSGGFFGGESMFHLKTDASKAAVSFLIEHLKSRGMTLLDAQAPTAHLASLGAIEIPRATYLKRLRDALQVQASFK